jgi:putative transposase
MTKLVPEKEWWTAEEIAGTTLPDLPETRQGVDALVKRMNWRAQRSFARRRSGKGGGWEYSWRLFPSRAQQKLLQAVAAAIEPARPERDEVWAWFEALPAKVQDKARGRLLVIQKVEALELALGRYLAVINVAKLDGIAARTIWNWFAMIEGVRPDDRMAYLAPRHRASVKPNSQAKDCSVEFFDQIKGDYLRLEAPPFTDCYRRSLRVAKAQGWDVLPERTMRRRMDAAVSAATQLLARKGVDAVKRLYPSQVRDKSALHALQAVNADFHKFDVFVRWPAGNGEEPQIIRPQMVAFQDIYSGRIVAWRLDQTPNSTAVMLCAGDMISEWGIPEHVLLDNGREFAAKAITGGASTRYRFKVKEDDIPGLFTALGCTIHWATPYSGQSKPIERAFRDMCSAISKDPRFAGAYTGNRPDAKPANYGSKAIDLEQFLTVLAEGIEEHNTRQGRRSEVAWGRSFAEVFDESYAQNPVRKATEAQQRLWLLGAEGITAHSSTGAVWFKGNEFWSEWMQSLAGRRVVIRFDPVNFWDGVHVYAADGAYLGHAPVRQKIGFFDMDEARAHARARSAWLKAEKAALAASRKLSAVEIGQSLDELAAQSEASLPKPEAKVVRGMFGDANAPGKPSRPRPQAAVSPDIEREQQAIIADLAARRNAPPPATETARDRFARALEIETIMAAGEPVTSEQQRWLSVYQTSTEYQTERLLFEDFGDAYLA